MQVEKHLLFFNKKSLLIGLFLLFSAVAFATDILPKCALLKIQFTIVDTCTMSATFTNASIPFKAGVLYKLKFGDGDSTLNVDTSHVYKVSGKYSVKLYVSAAEGCEADSIVDDTVSFKPINVELRTIPNIFTPNDDGKNDNFLLTNGKTKCVTEHMVIYSRWGEKVFETNDREKMFWNGNNGGSEMPAGVYFYVITGQGFKHSGSVTLIR